MTSVLDAWRAVDPEARLLSGSTEELARPVRGVARTRAAPPHVPDIGEGQLLVADARLMTGRDGADGVEALVGTLRSAAPEAVALWIVGDGVARDGALAAGGLPIITGQGSVAGRADALTRYLDTETELLAATAADLRLAGAEAALADPQPAAPAGVIAARLRRGVAVSVGGALVAVHPRSAGRALATRFAAAYGRVLHDRTTGPASRRTRDGLWTMERRIGPGDAAWLFDDLPFARVDEVALEALAVTLRALLRRPVVAAERHPIPRLPPSTGDPVRDTLLAVARANGRIAPAARVLGVHRNTVLYRLRVASAELGIDPRRPDDALRLLRDAESR
jgi:hypothetical protein